MKNLDILAIGDITSDAFIRLQQAHVVNAVDHVSQEICMPFGDKVPYEFVVTLRAVGNAANAAVSAARLGLTAALMTDIGTDENGNECIDTLKENKVGTDFVHKHKGMNTNFHYVLWYGSERTILVKHEKFPYEFPEIKTEPRWIYLTSLGEDSLAYHTQITAYLATHPNVKLMFQPGTYQMKFGIEKMQAIYKRTDIFVCNVEEARRILGDEKSEVVDLMKALHALGPKTVFVTDGVKGAYAYEKDVAYYMPIYPDIAEPYERTGAGDAFASTVMSAVALGKSVEEAALWGPINSMNVVQKIGAQEGLLSKEELLKYLNNAPADYKLRKI